MAPLQATLMKDFWHEMIEITSIVLTRERPWQARSQDFISTETKWTKNTERRAPKERLEGLGSVVS